MADGIGCKAMLFRCDANEQLGFGHFMRCRSLASALRERGVICGLIGPQACCSSEKIGSAFDLLYPVDGWRGCRDESEGILEVADAINAAGVVLDDYRSNHVLQSSLRGSGIKVVVFDPGTGGNLDADAIICANPSISEKDYIGRMMNQRARLYLGPKFIPLRKVFDCPAVALSDNEVKRILCTFGAGDDRGASLRMCRLLLRCEQLKSVEIVCVTTSRNPSCGELLKLAADRLQVLVDIDDMHEVMKGCQLAVTAGGTTTYELAACGNPMVIVALSENQRASMAWKIKGAAEYVGVFNKITDDEVISIVVDLVYDRSRRYGMASVARDLCDGKGAARLAASIINDMGGGYYGW